MFISFINITDITTVKFVLKQKKASSNTSIFHSENFFSEFHYEVLKSVLIKNRFHKNFISRLATNFCKRQLKESLNILLQNLLNSKDLLSRNLILLMHIIKYSPYETIYEIKQQRNCVLSAGGMIINHKIQRDTANCTMITKYYYQYYYQ